MDGGIRPGSKLVVRGHSVEIAKRPYFKLFTSETGTLHHMSYSLLWIAGPHSGWTWDSVHRYHIMGPTSVRIEDPCLFGLPVTLTVAHLSRTLGPARGSRQE